ncbi:hypothetical protein Y1Q_0019210 [Alligator mississippiensis]|uniref:Uncharacterized protein n=1 Tax=Alligator mississippiensis TaxID=8496 RepID=A0A151MQD1_ALLMI|nr:hypothetical protein Y1Q_0019210 [Alligator mississippiensis]
MALKLVLAVEQKAPEVVWRTLRGRAGQQEVFWGVGGILLIGTQAKEMGTRVADVWMGPTMMNILHKIQP